MKRTRKTKNGPPQTATKNVQLCVTEVEVSKLHLDATNPRLHGDQQIKLLTKSIAAFGFVSPILIDQDLRVIAGHGRIEAAKRLGFEKVPAISVAHLSEAQCRALMIADNRLAERASWGSKLLAEHFNILSEAELNFELDATGFEVPEIDLLIEGLLPAAEADCDPADDIPESSDSTQVSQLGDLWVLGRHRVWCSTGLEAKSYSVLMEGRRAVS